MPSSKVPANTAQHDALVADNEATEHQEDDVHEIIEESIEEDREEDDNESNKNSN